MKRTFEQSVRFALVGASLAVLVAAILAGSSAAWAERGENKAVPPESKQSAAVEPEDKSSHKRDSDSPDPQNTILPAQLTDTSFLYDIPIEDLVDADFQYDGQLVQVRGEVIGDKIWADLNHDAVWVSLISIKEGQDHTISVLMSPEDAEKIDIFGRYGATGTILQVKGVYHLVDKEHDGESDIVAQEVSVISPGLLHPDEFKFGNFVPGIVLVVIGVLLTVLFKRLQEEGR